jgi:hypothetical protein
VWHCMQAQDQATMLWLINRVLKAAAVTHSLKGAACHSQLQAQYIRALSQNGLYCCYMVQDAP